MNIQSFMVKEQTSYCWLVLRAAGGEIKFLCLIA
jgi:hypothetical protein